MFLYPPLYHGAPSTGTPSTTSTAIVSATEVSFSSRDQLVGLVIAFVLGALVLAAGHWLRTVVRDWHQRRQRRLGRRLKIVVLVDRKDSAKRRTSFWKEVLRVSTYDLRSKTKVRYVSIADELDHKRNPALHLFSGRTTDVIILNWDVVNGDPVYGSDRALQFLRHYRPDLLSWLHHGGLLLVESQGESWGTSNDPYECFSGMFADSQVKLCSGLWTLGNRAAVNPVHKSHLLAHGLQDDDLELKAGGLWARKPWFPRRARQSDIESLAFARRHQQLYRGWFEDWSADWDAVIVPRPDSLAPDPEPKTPHDATPARALVLCREVGSNGGPSPERGFVVLTTVFVASSELLALVSNFLSLEQHLRLSRGSRPSAKPPTGA